MPNTADLPAPTPINWHERAYTFLDTHVDEVMAVYNEAQTRILTCQDLDLAGRLLLDTWCQRGLTPVIEGWWQGTGLTMGPSNLEAFHAHVGTILNMVCLKAYNSERTFQATGADGFSEKNFRSLLTIALTLLKNARSLP